MAQSTNTSISTGARRRSQRVLMQVAVRIRGTDAQGKTIEEETETLAINAHGALVLLESRLTSGSKVQLQHKKTQEEHECHVAFLGPVRSGKAEIGLEFSTPQMCIRDSQKIIQSITSLGFIAMLVIPALDHRFAWSTMSLYVEVAGEVLVAIGFLIVFLVYKENTFTSAIIELAPEQKVISTGLYALVRHPMYMGCLLYTSRCV